MTDSNSGYPQPLDSVEEPSEKITVGEGGSIETRVSSAKAWVQAGRVVNNADNIRKSASVDTKETATDVDIEAQNKNLDDDVCAKETEYTLPADVYSILFVSKVKGQGFYYALYTFFLKIAMYGFLIADLWDNPFPDNEEAGRLVRTAQLFLLPTAVVIQEDLMASFFLSANVMYSDAVLEKTPGALKWKWEMSKFLRFVDGMVSLAVNILVLFQATDILGIFLNFAALQFIQSIDNLAHFLATDGYLNKRMQTIAILATDTKMPRVLAEDTYMDTVFFVATTLMTILGWIALFVLS